MTAVGPEEAGRGRRGARHGGGPSIGRPWAGVGKLQTGEWGLQFRFQRAMPPVRDTIISVWPPAVARQKVVFPLVVGDVRDLGLSLHQTTHNLCVTTQGDEMKRRAPKARLRHRALGPPPPAISPATSPSPYDHQWRRSFGVVRHGCARINPHERHTGLVPQPSRLYDPEQQAELCRPQLLLPNSPKDKNPPSPPPPRS